MRTMKAAVCPAVIGGGGAGAQNSGGRPRPGRSPLEGGHRAREARVLNGDASRRGRSPGSLAGLVAPAAADDKRGEGDDDSGTGHRVVLIPARKDSGGAAPGAAPGLWGIRRCARTSTRGGHMSRRVRALPPRALAAAAAQPVEIDSYFDKVLKYIPADIVAAWLAVTGPDPHG